MRRLFVSRVLCGCVWIGMSGLVTAAEASDEARIASQLVDSDGGWVVVLSSVLLLGIVCV
ncbi:hypothetical protein E2C01_013653 [Portunus trituberculatus]|uniref:Uncharacterized protein n=1 Tax=Portunus trituberculatus TaxID=210409 RepID=A0A5B7DH74_PORTR|nr:hypothetical protein [Portunus trituberculatus]